jgi:hypothetical protein
MVLRSEGPASRPPGPVAWRRPGAVDAGLGRRRLPASAGFLAAVWPAGKGWGRAGSAAFGRAPLAGVGDSAPWLASPCLASVR